MDAALEQIDLIRERMGVGYAEARDALEAAGGDVVGALAAIDQCQREQDSARGLQYAIARMMEEVKKALLDDGVIERIDVKLGDETVKAVPVALAGAGAALLVIISVLLAYLRLEIIMGTRPDTAEPET
ncbi:MAG: hypothetical protein HPY44_04360 [Armatimonadetes bacterium]|nr:hypothetical protein [Armatimonadota bacterium]